MVASSTWRPTGIEDLEPAAWSALRHAGSSCVVAGPGAGKTEFLAQRASYLLQTGICCAPRRILAISFKTDAAQNLALRVRERCEPIYSARFVSMTFDSFTKGLVDRFHSTIPEVWRPSRTYSVAFPNRNQINSFLADSRHSAKQEWQPAIAALSALDFESKIVGQYRLPLAVKTPGSAIEFVVLRWWRAQLENREQTAITFVSINRLAELLLRASVHVRRALRATYSFVFVDEFQDTTFAQYDFLRSAFEGSQSVVTAVGDDKQRIMVWAGARLDSFSRFEKDYAAQRFELQFNFRSSPDLVRIQQVVARAIDKNAVAAVARASPRISDDAAQVWRSKTTVSEARYLANWISNDMNSRVLRPRDYALLVRQKSEDYEMDLATAFAAQGLRLRNESRTIGKTTLQDLLVDDACSTAAELFRLGAVKRAPQSWTVVSQALQVIRSVDLDDQDYSSKVDEQLADFVSELRSRMMEAPPSAMGAQSIANDVFSFLDLPSLSATNFRYASGDLLSIMVDAFCLHIASCATGSATWEDCINAFQGVSQIPLMTVHKSKGLEYDTTVFVGLDDNAWWSYSRDNPEGLATFFVALSRAKQRAIFSFCEARGRRHKIADLYQLLAAAGVSEVAIPE